MKTIFTSYLLLIPYFAFMQIKSPNEELFNNPPKTLFPIDKSVTKLSWSSIVANHYFYFSATGSKNLVGDTSQISVNECVKPIFGAVYNWVYPLGYNGAREYPSLYNKDTYISIVKKFYQSPSSQKTLYNWIKPFYVEAYKLLPAWKKKIYKDMLKHLKKYIKEFNYTAELKRYEDSKILYKPNSNAPTPSFTYMGPKGIRGKFGVIEAFVFRRIHNKDLTLEQMSQWANTIEKDFNLK